MIFCSIARTHMYSYIYICVCVYGFPSGKRLRLYERVLSLMAGHDILHLHKE